MGSGRDDDRHDHPTPPVGPAHPTSDPAAHQLLQLMSVLRAVGQGRAEGVRQLGRDLVEDGIALDEAARGDLRLSLIHI